ncbi:winged-helix domain-containing protein [Cytophaga aurantiaca]|uniref:winged-helix domain-containing protein n=1 Tax=Cytophaga aurantiaca TaxID=29530 RepID=UPI00036739F4|nr:winged-helix domain-containing protein [Cytophaga aurantiaca]
MSYENKIYNPASQDKNQLIERFVVRTNVFEKIFKDIRTGEMKYPEQHYLIQGQRGMGKTTLLLRLKYEIENTPELNTWLTPVFFNEESYDLTSLSNLWEKLLKYLDELWGTGGAYYDKTNDFVSRQDYEKKCFEWLQQILNKENKKLIIFFDNFGELFLNNLKEKEQHRLREILMNSSDIRIVGASAIVLNDLHDYSKPFYEFFKIMPLEGLNKEETYNLISKLQDKSIDKIDLEKSKAKIETLAILTGGVIRTIMLVYEVILADQDGSALKDLESILDRITPLYKHRMEDLPVQQRRIVDVIAKKWDAISTKEIAENIREDGEQISTKTISAQLQQLEKNNVIEKKQTNTKNHLYQMKERFFNIWYLMRHGDRNDKCKVKWLTKFLETWYADEYEMKSFINRHIKHLQSGKYYSQSAILIVDALSNSIHIDFENRIKLLEETFNILNDEDRKLLPSINSQKERQAFGLYQERKFIDAINILETIEQSEDSINELLALCYLETNNIDKGYNIIIKVKDSNMKKLILGDINIFWEKYDKAIEYFLAVLNNPQFKNKGEIANKIGLIYKRKNEFEKAIQYYLISIKEGNVKSYNQLIDLYVNLEQFELAEKYCFEGINSGNFDCYKDLIMIYIFNIQSFSKADFIIEKELMNNPKDLDYLFLKGINLFLYDDDVKKSERIFIEAYKLANKKNAPLNQYSIIGKAMLADISIERKNKINALKAIEGFDFQEIGGLGLVIFLYIHVWDDRFDDTFVLINQHAEEIFLNDGELNHDYLKKIILLLLAKKQYHFTYSLFENKKINLKERMKPIYYALMFYMQKEYPNEYLKMGEELKQPVEDVLKEIKKMAIDYK